MMNVLNGTRRASDIIRHIVYLRTIGLRQFPYTTVLTALYNALRQPIDGEERRRRGEKN